MEKSVQQEILLMTNSSLSKRNLCERESSDSKGHFSDVDRLQQACWNGMLDEFLPGVVERVEGKTMFLWEIQSGKSFLHIDLCDRPDYINKESSIDPYIFLSYIQYN
jgi:hypothetical protein